MRHRPRRLFKLSLRFGSRLRSGPLQSSANPSSSVRALRHCCQASNSSPAPPLKPPAPSLSYIKRRSERKWRRAVSAAAATDGSERRTCSGTSPVHVQRLLHQPKERPDNRVSSGTEGTA